MIKENRNQVVIPEVSHKQVNKAWKNFLRRHGWKVEDMAIKPKGGKDEQS